MTHCAGAEALSFEGQYSYIREPTVTRAELPVRSAGSRSANTKLPSFAVWL